jgi:hypothetical protein
MKAANLWASALILISSVATGVALADDDVINEKTPADDAVAAEVAEQTGCQTAEWYCANYPPMFGLSCESVSGGCEGRDCQGVNQGVEARFIPLGGLPFTDWMAITEGEFVPIGLACVVDTDKQTPPHITLFDTGAAGHCAALLLTEEHFFVEFFAGVSYCSGWVECQCN